MGDGGPSGEAAVATLGHGDISRMTEDQQAAYIMKVCDSVGLNPYTQPFEIIEFQGRKRLYATRKATDQLAAVHRIDREILDGPSYQKDGEFRVAYCKVLATHPNGRKEVEIATMKPSDPFTDLMKVTTKAKRRATLSICGLGFLDESEVEDLRDRYNAKIYQAPVARQSEEPKQMTPSNSPKELPPPAPNSWSQKVAANAGSYLSLHQLLIDVQKERDQEKRAEAQSDIVRQMSVRLSTLSFPALLAQAKQAYGQLPAELQEELKPTLWDALEQTAKRLGVHGGQ